MKKLFGTLLISSVIALSALAQSPLAKYRNTKWELHQMDGAEQHHFEVIFDKKGATLMYNGEPLLTATKLEYALSKDPDGIHGNQNYIIFHNDGEMLMGLFEGGENCLLLPDTEAPEDCFVRVR